MISVIVYGRNDSYGYNLAKRAAISINCIARLLDDTDDEIIFVDCNTPNDMPTFPESIADTLTPAAKKLLRVLRLRPDQYERGRNGAKFQVLEPLCRNVAIRRSNPRNRWILNTNTDMVFAPLEDGVSLSQIAAELEDGFYELPRFEIPESLWESCDRMDPTATTQAFRRWGLRLHINEIIPSTPEILFDGPGDFQLALRSQLFQIHGMNEQMVLGWTVDSNLCRRMWLLNGETSTLLDRLYAFHCDHTRIHTVYHRASKSTVNSLDEFFINVSTPYVSQQAESWGMPDETIEEFKLSDSHMNRLSSGLESLLPGMDAPLQSISVFGDIMDASLFYDEHHVFPYLADVILNSPPRSPLGYIGNNLKMLRMLGDIMPKIGLCKGIMCCAETAMNELPSGSGNRRIASFTEIHNSCDTIIFDLSMKHLPARVNGDGFTIPQKCPQVLRYVRLIFDLMTSFARQDIHSPKKLRHYVFVGCHNSWFDIYLLQLFACALTPVSTYIRNGSVRPDAFESGDPIMPLHAYVIGHTSEDSSECISAFLKRPITPRQFTEANDVYKKFVSQAADKKAALETFDQLMTYDAGPGVVELEIAKAKINGIPDMAIELVRLLDSYRTPSHDGNA